MAITRMHTMRKQPVSNAMIPADMQRAILRGILKTLLISCLPACFELSRCAQADLTGNLPMTISVTQVQAGNKLNLNYTIRNNSATAVGAFSVRVSLGTSAYGTQTAIQTFQINSLTLSEKGSLLFTDTRFCRG